MRLVFALLALTLALGARAQQASQYAIDIPPWFTETFLDFREDVADAARDGKRLMLYFGQDGCPYCRQLMVTNFSQPTIVAKTRQHFVAIALNIWGDRETHWIDGRARTEKELARFLDVQFTPTLLFLDEHAKVLARLDGYYPPQKFEAVLDYVANRMENKLPLADYVRDAAQAPASSRLHDEPFFLSPPYDLRHRAKPLAVIFETTDCTACDEMHRDAFTRPEVLAQVAQFDVVRLALGAPTPVRTPDGRASTADAWAHELGIAYTPSVVFFGADGAEIFRVRAYVRPFHLASAFDYVASGAYREEPSFQRFIQQRAERIRANGGNVDLWK
jgi:thioredoxin-related protein